VKIAENKRSKIIFLSPKVSFEQVKTDAIKLNFSRIFEINGDETKDGRNDKINMWKSIDNTLLLLTFEMFMLAKTELEMGVMDVLIIDEAHKTLSQGTKSCQKLLYEGVSGKTIYMSGTFVQKHANMRIGDCRIQTHLKKLCTHLVSR